MLKYITKTSKTSTKDSSISASASASDNMASSAASVATDIQKMSRIITSRGYAVLKSALTDKQHQLIRKELTVAPAVLEAYSKSITPFPIYCESASRYYVPRAWGITNLGEPEANIVSNGVPLPESVTFKGKPYDYQEQIISTFIDKGANGLICVPCGRGKTFMALNIAVRLGHRFLIVVDKEFLMNQWKGEIENYVSGMRVGIIQGPKVEIDPEKYDCTICMLQTICQRDYAPNFFAGYGLAIFDECHKLGAQVFSRSLMKIQVRNMLGLSATPDRDDGLTKVFEYYLGKPVYQEKVREPDSSVVVQAIWFRSEDPAYAEVPKNWKGETVTAKLMTQIVTCKPRTAKIVEIIRELSEDANRQLLVLAERKCLLEDFENSLKNLKNSRKENYRVGYYIGGMDSEVLDRNATTCQILLATYAMASDALNIKTLNTCVMASPRKKVEQSTGRILRLRPENRKANPIIVDVIDQHETYVRQWWIRQRYYKQCEYTIEHINRKKETSVARQASADGCLISFSGSGEGDDEEKTALEEGAVESEYDE
jgi:superfamily II DNA or RNA helicase